jgi:nitrogen fixation-related uncharacterized protein
MKALFVLLVLSVLTVLVALCAMWWRLRRQLRQSDQGLKNTLEEIPPAQESMEQQSMEQRRS